MLRRRLPFPSVEQLSRSQEVTFLFRELTTIDRIARPTHMSSFVPESFQIFAQLSVKSIFVR